MRSRIVSDKKITRLQPSTVIAVAVEGTLYAPSGLRVSSCAIKYL